MTQLFFKSLPVMLLFASVVCHAQKVARDAEIYIYTKSGNMTVQMAEYKDESVITVFMFDDYGAFLRVDEAGGKTWIADVTAKKAYIYSAWKGIFFRTGTGNGETVFTATAFSEMVPKNSFTVPEDYKKVLFED